jgi:hypothetical protein
MVAIEEKISVSVKVMTIICVGIVTMKNTASVVLETMTVTTGIQSDSMNF